MFSWFKIHVAIIITCKKQSKFMLLNPLIFFLLTSLDEYSLHCLVEIKVMYSYDLVSFALYSLLLVVTFLAGFSYFLCEHLSNKKKIVYFFLLLWVISSIPLTWFNLTYPWMHQRQTFVVCVCSCVFAGFIYNLQFLFIILFPS